MPLREHRSAGDRTLHRAALRARERASGGAGRSGRMGHGVRIGSRRQRAGGRRGRASPRRLRARDRRGRQPGWWTRSRGPGRAHGPARRDRRRCVRAAEREARHRADG